MSALAGRKRCRCSGAGLPTACALPLQSTDYISLCQRAGPRTHPDPFPSPWPSCELPAAHLGAPARGAGPGGGGRVRRVYLGGEGPVAVHVLSRLVVHARRVRLGRKARAVWLAAFLRQPINETCLGCRDSDDREETQHPEGRRRRRVRARRPVRPGSRLITAAPAAAGVYPHPPASQSTVNQPRLAPLAAAQVGLSSYCAGSKLLPGRLAVPTISHHHSCLFSTPRRAHGLALFLLCLFASVQLDSEEALPPCQRSFPAQPEPARQ